MLLVVQIQSVRSFSEHAVFLRLTRRKHFSAAVIIMDSDKLEESVQTLHHEQVLDQARNCTEKPIYRDPHGLPLNPQPTSSKDDPLVRNNKYFSLLVSFYALPRLTINRTGIPPSSLGLRCR